MRFKITKKIREDILRYDLPKIYSKSPMLKWHIKNILYKNKTISQLQLDLFRNNGINISGKLIPVYFAKEKNLGKYAETEKINFKGKNEKFAEFIGVILGDGNIYENNIRISLDKRQRKYEKYLSRLFYELFGVRLWRYESKKTNQLAIYKSNRHLANLLFKYGLKRGNKIKNNIGIPFWIIKNKSYSVGCLRGLVDTDGCIYYCKRERRNYIKFTNKSKRLLMDFKKMAKNLGFDFSKAGEYSVCLYKKDQVVRYIKNIGFSNPYKKATR